MWRLACCAAALLALAVADTNAAIAQVASASAPAARRVVAAAPGRIEGSNPAVAVGAAITGIVDKVPVRQGDKVSAGDLLVHIACQEVEAQLAARVAEHDAAEAVNRRLVNGPRQEDINIAEADMRLAEARLAEAQVRVTRSSTLLDRNAVSQATRDVDERDLRIATAQLDAARLRLRLLRAGTREEELAEAKARLLAAAHQVDVTRAELNKCDIRSPVTGIVLRKDVTEGELVSLFYPKPLMMIAETRDYRVRAEVDEQDVGRIRRGQNAEIVVNALDRKHLRAHVARLAPVMGRRQILTSDPADKSDRDVMEVIVDFDDKPDDLPIGLRVSVIFLE